MQQVHKVLHTFYMVMIMKQTIFYLAVIIILTITGCQQALSTAESTQIMDAAWQQVTQATTMSTVPTEERSDNTVPTQHTVPVTTVPLTQPTQPIIPPTTEGMDKNDKEDPAPTETVPITTSPTATMETKPVIEETFPPTAVTESATKPTEQKKPQETVPTGSWVDPAVTEPFVTQPPATTVPVITEKPTQPETQPTEPTKPQNTLETAFSIDYWISFARNYAEKAGLELDEEAVWCWDNPITASAKSKYLERDICGILDRYSNDPDISAVWVWAEKRSDSVWNIYIGYA